MLSGSTASLGFRDAAGFAVAAAGSLRERIAEVGAAFFGEGKEALHNLGMSGGNVGGGLYHSQNPEAWFIHRAGLKVVAPSSPGSKSWAPASMVLE